MEVKIWMWEPLYSSDSCCCYTGLFSCWGCTSLILVMINPQLIPSKPPKAVLSPDLTAFFYSIYWLASVWTAEITNFWGGSNSQLLTRYFNRPDRAFFLAKTTELPAFWQLNSTTTRKFPSERRDEGLLLWLEVVQSRFCSPRRRVQNRGSRLYVGSKQQKQSKSSFKLS